MATFSNEIQRRLKTTSTALGATTNENIIGEVMDNLQAMCYSEVWRSRVLRGAITGYSRVLHKVTKGDTSRNRKGAERLVSRRFKALVGSKDWFRVEKQDDAWEAMPPWERSAHIIHKKTTRNQHDPRYIERVMLIPHTPGGTLKTLVRPT